MDEDCLACGARLSQPDHGKQVCPDCRLSLAGYYDAAEMACEAEYEIEAECEAG